MTGEYATRLAQISDEHTNLVQTTHEQRKRALADAIEHSETENQELHGQHGALRAAHDELKATHEELRATHDELKSAYDELKTAHDGLKEEHQDLQQAHSTLTQGTVRYVSTQQYVAVYEI